MIIEGRNPRQYVFQEATFFSGLNHTHGQKIEGSWMSPHRFVQASSICDLLSHILNNKS
jgi:hypothetical protein